MISIIIPAYNEERHIKACLTSIVNVDYPKTGYEVILVDNGSTDRTKEIAGQFDIAIFTDQDRNVSGLRNLGAKYAKGEILAFIDADCLATPQWLKNASLHIQNNKLAAWGAPPEIPDNPTWVQETWFIVRKKEIQLEMVEWLESMNLFVRKTLFLNVGGFNESLVTCEDVDFCYRISNYGKILSDTALGVVHLGEARTLREFVKKELWRGKSNLKGIYSHGLKFNEIPSLFVPVYFGVLFPLILVFSILSKNSLYLCVCLIFYLSPSVLLILKVRKKLSRLLDLFRLSYLVQFYFWARTIAATRSM
jgi:glycosyltransferase involved in cell wall biosynthesis